MFGDDPDPSVMTERFVEEVLDAREESDKSPWRQGGLMGSEKREKRAATMSGCKFENNDGNRVPMQCE